MAYVRIGGGSQIDLDRYFATLPTSAGAYNCDCRSAEGCWIAISGGGAGFGSIGLWADGQVYVSVIGDGHFTLYNENSQPIGSVTQNTGAKTLVFHPGYVFGTHLPAGTSITMRWSPLS